MPEISIIVPVYKVEKYIHRCVNSILSQTFSDFELILVDDGSPDSCGTICDSYALADLRVKVIHQQNSGAAAARNAGLNIAQGKYILFCDADDCYNTDVLSYFLSYALRKYPNDTLLCFDFRNVWPSGIEETERYKKSSLLVDESNRFLFLSSFAAHDIAGYSLWNKLYSKEIIDQYNIRMPERSNVNNKDDWAEDLVFNLQYYSVINTVIATGLPAYLLTKHTELGKENETAVYSRTEHMLALFSWLHGLPIVKNNPAYDVHFWKIVIWHIRRFLYADAKATGIEQLRETCICSPHALQLQNWLDTALSHWDQLKVNWGEFDAMDYRFLLQYIRDGKLLRYKMKSCWIWKIRTAFEK